MKAQRMPEETVARLPHFVEALRRFVDEGITVTSSRELSEAAGSNPAQLRKDLSYLGDFGTPGVGYDVKSLLAELSRHLGLDRTWRVAIVGYGNLGSALTGYAGFQERGFEVVAIFDSSPAKVGRTVDRLKILDVENLEQVVQDLHIDIAIISTPASAAQRVAEKLVVAGVRSILNFSPAVLAVPPHVSVRHIDLSLEMQILSFYEVLNIDAESPITAKD
jgi:redox-sensing transcriptional repressor